MTTSYDLLRARRYKHSQFTHGMSGTRPHRIWAGIKRRCYNKNDKSYPQYGGNGITVCKRWGTFQGFWNDMQHGYSDALTIDRIDNSKGYSPSNCRWATKLQQSHNRRNMRLIQFNGKQMSLRQIAGVLGFKSSTLQNRRRRGYDIQTIVSSPTNSLKHKTYCRQGHTLSGNNEYRGPDGKRRCRMCRAKSSYKRNHPSNAPACEAVLKLLDSKKV